MDLPRAHQLFFEDLPHCVHPPRGIAGEIKEEPRHFAVREIPLYSPSDEGEHIYLYITREGWTTQEVVSTLAETLDLKIVHIGFAGIKDKWARASQVFSLHLHKEDPEDIAAQVAGETEFTVEWARRHTNKLRRGHLAGNEFVITVTNPGENALEVATDIDRSLPDRGVPNYYGPQRLGDENQTARQGRQVLLGERKKRGWLRQLYISAYQSALFNRWIAHRLQLGQLYEISEGDWVEKTDTGGGFLVEDLSFDRDRFANREIAVTGPMYGRKMKRAGGEPGEIEDRLLGDEELDWEVWRRARIDGTRRQALVRPEGLEITAGEEGLKFSFSLPRGSYATSILREFLRGPESAE